MVDYLGECVSFVVVLFVVMFMCVGGVVSVDGWVVCVCGLMIG